MVKRYSNEHKLALCQAWQISAQSKIAFCKERKISESALYSWLKQWPQYNKSHDSATNHTNTAIKFLSVKPLPQNSTYSLTDNLIEINMPNGCQIKTSLAAPHFKLLLQELLQWK